MKRFNKKNIKIVVNDTEYCMRNHIQFSGDFLNDWNAIKESYSLPIKNPDQIKEISYENRNYNVFYFSSFIEAVFQDRYQWISDNIQAKYILNIGASDGCSILPIISKNSIVQNIEPEQKMFHILCKNFPAPNFENFNMALTDDKELHYSQLRDGVQDFEIETQEEYKNVTEVKDFMISPMTELVKIDAQNNETYIIHNLPDTILTNRPLIYIANYKYKEILHPDIQRIINKLSDYNYELMHFNHQSIGFK